MYRLTNLALKATFKESHPQEYDPPHTNVRKWVHSTESL